MRAGTDDDRQLQLFTILHIKKQSVHYRILRSYKDTLHGPSDRIRTCGILLPKQARYQLRYTRLLSYSIRLGVFSQTTRATSCANPGFLVIEFLRQMWSNMWSSSFFDHLDLRGKCLYRRRIKGLRT